MNDKRSNLLGANFTYVGCPNFTLQIGGNCPVQANGEIGDSGNSNRYYFRSRHEHISIEIYEGKKVIYSAEEENSNASWLPIDQCLRFIGKHVHKFWKEQGAFRRIEKVFGKDILDEYKAKCKPKKDKQ